MKAYILKLLPIKLRLSDRLSIIIRFSDWTGYKDASSWIYCSHAMKDESTRFENHIISSFLNSG